MLANSSAVFAAGSGYSIVGTSAFGTSPSMSRFSQIDTSAQQTVASTATGTPIIGTVAVEIKAAVQHRPCPPMVAGQAVNRAAVI